MSDEKNKNVDDELLIEGHDYDGIQELDNPLPQWWLVTFFGTIIFGFLYWVYYEPLSGPTLTEELNQDLARIEQMQKSAEEEAPKAADVNFDDLQNDAAAMARAEKHYQTKCASCHANQMQGLIGPNLVDNYWIYDKGDNATLVKLIQDGIPDKGMPPWKGIIKDREIMELVAYIKSKSGSNPPNPKEPQGELVE